MAAVRPSTVRFACVLLLIPRHTISDASLLVRHNLDQPSPPLLPFLQSQLRSINHIAGKSSSANAAFTYRAISTRSRHYRSSAATINPRCNTFFHHSLKHHSLARKMSVHEGLSDIGKSMDNSNKNSSNEGISHWKSLIDISIAKSRKIRGSNYVQISTVNYETMEPKCRTVVFRGFMKGVPFGAVRDVLEGGMNEEEENDSTSNYYSDCVMKMITDVRSNKVKELEMFHGGHENKVNGKSNTAEMVWWFPKTSEQYRISGKLQFIGSNGPLHSYTPDITNHKDYFIAERKQQWGNLSDMAREQFYWDMPGIPHGSASDSMPPPTGGRDADGKVLPVPDTFLLMLLYPTKVDYLRLGDNYRQIDEWRWTCDVGDDGECRWKSMRVNP